MKSPIIPLHPLDRPGSIKILLGREASEAIAANGDFHLAAITRPDATSPPHHDGRLVLVCIPATKDQLDAAYRVASGTHRAAKIKAPKKPRPDQYAPARGNDPQCRLVPNAAQTGAPPARVRKP